MSKMMKSLVAAIGAGLEVPSSENVVICGGGAGSTYWTSDTVAGRSFNSEYHGGGSDN